MDEKMEIRLVNPTEDGFLQKIDWNKAELEENVRSIVAAYQAWCIRKIRYRMRRMTEPSLENCSMRLRTEESSSRKSAWSRMKCSRVT